MATAPNHNKRSARETSVEIVVAERPMIAAGIANSTKANPLRAALSEINMVRSSLSLTEYIMNPIITTIKTIPPNADETSVGQSASGKSRRMRNCVGSEAKARQISITRNDLFDTLSSVNESPLVVIV